MVMGQDCNREMLLAASCGARLVELAGERDERLPYRPPGSQRDLASRCHDCGIRPGGFHHFGSDMDRCPRCGGQLCCCSCWPDDEEDDDEPFVVGVEGLEPPTSAL